MNEPTVYGLDYTKDDDKPMFNMNEPVIYKPGETNLRTSVHGGLCDYTENPDTNKPYTIVEYLEHLGDGYVCIEFKDALKMITEAETTKYVKPWIEIDEDRWDEMLNVLPPMRWRTVRGIEFFQMSEMLTGDLTGTFAKIRGLRLPGGPKSERFFEATRRVSDDYGDMARDISVLL